MVKIWNAARNVGIAMLIASTAALGACEDEGTAEKAGKKVDEAVQDTQEAVKDAADSAEQKVEEAQEAAKEAMKKVTDPAEDAAEEAADEANEAAEDAKEAIGQHVWDTTRVGDVSEFVDKVLADGREQSAEIRVADHPPPRTLEIHASPLMAPSGGIGGAVLVLHDVTDLRRLEAMRTDFVANVSHELKTPLAAIQGLIETLADDEGMEGEVRQRFLGRARDQVLRLSALVTDLLALSQVESEARSLERRSLDLRDVLQESESRLDLTGRMRELDVAVELPDEIVPVLGDEEALGRIVDNLLDNAVKYTEDGGEIRVRLTTEGDHAAIEIGDTGIGIEERHLSRIFERFYRVDKARSRALGGTGLGLAIVKHLVEAHGGRVEVESEPGEGTNFRLLLPLDPLDAAGLVREAEEA